MPLRTSLYVLYVYAAYHEHLGRQLAAWCDWQLVPFPPSRSFACRMQAASMPNCASNKCCLVAKSGMVGCL